jgi:hypothetical protein
MRERGRERETERERESERRVKKGRDAEMKHLPNIKQSFHKIPLEREEAQRRV